MLSVCRSKVFGGGGYMSSIQVLVTVSLLLLIECCFCCPGQEELATLSCANQTALSSVCRCFRYNDTFTVCCNINKDYYLKESMACAGIPSNQTTHVVIQNLMLDELDAYYYNWSNVASLYIVDSQIGKISGSFSSPSLSCVNVSSSSLLEISNGAFSSLQNLEILDLSNNNLTKLPRIIPTQKENISIDISGNAGLWCSSVKDLMTGLQNSTTSLGFLSYNDTSCLSSWSFHWFNSTEVVPLAQVEIVLRLETECPKGDDYFCTCSVSRFDKPPGKPPRVAIKVDCADQGLTYLPPILPPNTIWLNVTNNNISDLTPLSSEKSYEDLREFFADNNRIDSIVPLEGTKFIHSFEVLSLKGNMLKFIPTYILSDAFDRNVHSRHVNLGGNKLNCDCNTAQAFKDWLKTNKKHIPDYNEIICQDYEKVVALDPAKICVYQKDWTDYIYYIIAVEVFLLLLLFSKVAYDYWVFKTAGYLPWPASKMPKLPCDWVFET